jgi:hypothetical protein
VDERGEGGSKTGSGGGLVGLTVGGGAATVVIGNAPGRVRWLGHRRWTGGVEGGAVEERTRHTDVY